jgi:hypothetical protein
MALGVQAWYAGHWSPADPVTTQAPPGPAWSLPLASNGRFGGGLGARSDVRAAVEGSSVNAISLEAEDD